MSDAPSKRTSKTAKASTPEATRTKMLLAAEGLVAGWNQDAVCEHAGVGRTTLWRWRSEDSEVGAAFRAIYHQLSAEVFEDTTERAVVRMRSLADRAVLRFADGIEADQRYTAIKVKDGEGGEQVLKVPVPDLSLAVKTADLTLKRFAELAPKSQMDVNHSGTLEARIRAYHDGGPKPYD